MHEAGRPPLLLDPITTVTVTAAGIGGEGQQCVLGTASNGAVDVLVLSGDLVTTGYAQDVPGHDHAGQRARNRGQGGA